jgi:uncharacterized membrane protein
MIDLSLYGFKGLTEVFNVHPVFVHFPIVLLPVTLLFYGLGVWKKNRCLLIAGRVCLYLALLAVLAAVGTGLDASDEIPHNEVIHHMMGTHQNTGFIILGLTLLLTVWSFWQVEQRPKGAWPFTAVLVIASYFVLQNGDIGSRMVYVQGAAVKPAVPIVSAGEHEHGHDHGEQEHQH